jgi:hypothetical protein
MPRRLFGLTVDVPGLVAARRQGLFCLALKGREVPRIQKMSAHIQTE